MLVPVRRSHDEVARPDNHSNSGDFVKQYGLLCQSCGIEAPTKQVEFYQNIGALVVRFHKNVKGRLCKQCVHKHFWAMTGTTVAIGWLGYISLVIAPVFVLNNVFRYLFALPMPGVPVGARVPVVTNEMAAKIGPHYQTVVDRVNTGTDFEQVVREMAPAVGVTPGELMTYVMLVAQSRQAAQYAPPPTAHGFPVVMPASTPPPLPAARQA